MYGSTRVSLSVKELIILKAAIAAEIRSIDKLVEYVGDPIGIQAKNKAEAESLYEKLGRAIKRA